MQFLALRAAWRGRGQRGSIMSLLHPHTQGTSTAFNYRQGAGGWLQTAVAMMVPWVWSAFCKQDAHCSEILWLLNTWWALRWSLVKKSLNIAWPRHQFLIMKARLDGVNHNQSVRKIREGVALSPISLFNFPGCLWGLDRIWLRMNAYDMMIWSHGCCFCLPFPSSVSARLSSPRHQALFHTVKLSWQVKTPVTLLWDLHIYSTINSASTFAVRLSHLQSPRVIGLESHLLVISFYLVP